MTLLHQLLTGLFFISRLIVYVTRDNKDATPIERCTFDVETKNGLPSTVQLFYEESKDNEPLANIHFQAIGSGFLTFVNACQNMMTTA